MKGRGCLLGTLSIFVWVGLLLLLVVESVVAIQEADVVSALQGIHGFLARSHEGLRDGDKFDERVEEYIREVDNLRLLHEQLMNQEKEVERLVTLTNAKLVDDLATRLTATLEKEILLRSAIDSCKVDVVPVVEKEVAYVNRDDLRRQFDLISILTESDRQLSEWIHSIVLDEIANYKNGLVKSAADSIPTIEVEEIPEQTGDCLGVTDVVKEVQVELTKFSQDGIGLIDHAQGAQVVHSMTSPTYEPPVSEEEMMGNVWWRRYIPEDWEQLLPTGWERWSVRLPSYIYHSLNINGAKTARAETILNKKVVPGSCWPMNGSRGQVTIRLPYPIKVESFTLDHVSWRIVTEYTLESAPKKVQVIAYPPCDEPERCGALGFDVSEPMQVAQFEYSTEGSVSQTFDSIFVSSTSTPESDHENEIEEEDGEEGGSCSKEAAACTKPPHIEVAAITLKVLENHGNPDYTCIYRFRVHGQQILIL